MVVWPWYTWPPKDHLANKKHFAKKMVFKNMCGFLDLVQQASKKALGQQKTLRQKIAVQEHVWFLALVHLASNKNTWPKNQYGIPLVIPLMQFFV